MAPGVLLDHSSYDDHKCAGLQEVLTDALHDLAKIEARLSLPHIHAQLLSNLHDPNHLPDKALADLRDQVIDVLDATDKLLQPGHLVLADKFLGYANSKCLVAAVRQKVPDILAKKGPLKTDDLADAAGARRDRFRQIMRILYNDGIFSYDHATDSYINNHRSELLRSDHWTQWHNWVELYGNQFYDMARGIPDSIKVDADRSAAQYSFNTREDMFTYFEKSGWLPQLHRTLGSGAIAQAPGICADYPWSDVGDKTVIDIGGGSGALIASLLRENLDMRGGVYDLPAVIEHIRPSFAQGGQFEDVGARVSHDTLIPGDFFQSIPSSEVYVMKWTLHDWLDPEAVTILKNVRKAIVPGEKSRLVVLESCLADGSAGRLSRYGDINMMITAKGLERSEAEWRKLADVSGWEVVGVHPMRNTWVSAIDFRPR